MIDGETASEDSLEAASLDPLHVFVPDQDKKSDDTPSCKTPHVENLSSIGIVARTRSWVRPV